ncbi:hypothetical protein NUU61_003251 [Penicillium alfredii]|uniref:Hyaluronan/mRNA-binding protein domain-containing protein n=1 Tax=Penicillium alfredii TaxID=1506179 RepID=A0A9W9FT80_9EURO|nr:uncharacterized protein NUU61_003251 [Penicillium alfredii]KAJ5105904.1 hypothetical protein NUU61_003251 [Penicillium alfredii]
MIQNSTPTDPPQPPTRAVDRPVPRHGKRDAPKEPIDQPRLSESNARRGGRVTGGNEAAFRDRNAGRINNRQKPTDEAAPPSRRGERSGRGRGDRQSRTGQTDTRKQVQQGWGADSGEKTWDDERQAENIAKDDETAPQTPADEEAKELVDNSKSYSDYLAEQAQKDTLAAKPVRAANEGSKADKKWAEAKELKRGEGEDSYIQATQEKTKREKQRKEKNFLDVDLRFVEQPRSGPSNGPRGGRGGRGSDRPRGGDRGRAGPRGGAPRGGGAPRDGGAPRGGRGGPRGPAGPTVDEKNFPSLGGN